MTQTCQPGSSATNYGRRLMLSLTIPAYRWLWFNSVFGTMRLITVFVVRGWLVLTLTDSPFWVGAAPALRGIMQIMLGTFAGALLDRVNRRVALLIAEIGVSIVAMIVGLLVISGQIELWHILAASALEGMFMSIRWPAINTMVLQTVGPSRMLNASAAQMLGFNLGNIVASGMAGLLVEAFGIGVSYLFAAGFGLIAAGCVWFVRGEFRPKSGQVAVGRSIRAGLGYIRHHQALFSLIILAFLMSLLGWSNLSMLPVMARDVLGADASGLGFLVMAGAVGSLISTTVVAGLGDYQNKIRLILVSGLCTVFGIMLFALSASYLLSLLLIGLMHGALMSFDVSITALVLIITAERMQGRVQGVYTQVFGFTWVGGIILGAIAEFSSAPAAIMIGSAAIGLAMAIMWRSINGIELEYSS